MRRAASRRAVGTITGLLAVGGLALAPTATAVDGFALTRIAGADRYATAAALASAAFPEGSAVAIVASGERFPDALAASYLAGRFGDGAPILLTTKDALPTSTATALDTLEVDTVYVVGGTAAVSQGVEDSLKAADRTVTRIAGDDRYDTAADIAAFEAEGAADPGTVGGATTVIVANGEGFADALAAGPLAFAGNLPVVLTPAAELDDAAKEAIAGVNAERAWIVGGTGAVSAAVEDELKAMDLTTVRIAGPNRYATATAAASRGRADLGLTATAVDLASGETFPDALAAGPASGAANRALLLTARAELSDATESYLKANSGTLSQGRVFGGTAAVSQVAVSQANAAGASGDSLAVARIVGLRASENEYDYVTDGEDEVVTVAYDPSDDFTVDGQDAAESGFEAQVTNGDIIVVDDPDSPSEHDLTNVSAASFTIGMVGNVDIADKQLDIIEPVSGAIFRRDVPYAGTFRVDGATTDAAGFEGDINEGDTIEIAGGAFNLTNRTVAGAARQVEVVEAPIPVITTNQTRFAVDRLGDDPASSSDPGKVPDEADAGNDDRFVATGTNQQLTVDGATATYAQFEAALNNGDQVTYSRADGIEKIAIVNEDETVEGEVTGTPSADGSDPDLTPGTTDGGSFSLQTASGAITVAYTASTDLLIDGLVVDEAEFEDAISAGDSAVVTRNGTTIESIDLTDEV